MQFTRMLAWERATGLTAESREHETNMNNAEIEERARLDDCQVRIRNALAAIDTRLRDYAQEIQTRKEYMWDARRDMCYVFLSERAEALAHPAHGEDLRRSRS
jgi:two-component sensor histidine kinase